MQNKNWINRMNEDIQNIFGSRKLAPFPWVIPVNIDDINLGDLVVDFIRNDDTTKIPKNLRRYNIAILELWQSFFLLRSIVELAVIIEEKHSRTDLGTKSWITFVSMYITGVISPLYLTPIPDELIFEIVSAEGPVSLCRSEAQMKIIEWLSDGEIANRKLQKLMESLLCYSECVLLKGKAKKYGASEKELFRHFGRDWIREMYFDIHSILKIIKQNRRQYLLKEKEELVEKSFLIYMLTKMKKTSSGKRNKNKDIKLERLKNYIKHKEHYKISNPISACLKENEKLKNEFIKMQWAPSYMAKKIMEELLNIDYETIKRIVYPPRTKRK